MLDYDISQLHNLYLLCLEATLKKLLETMKKTIRSNNEKKLLEATMKKNY
jgi:hypothetical protein